MFNWDLFLNICKEYGVPLSSEYKVPMLEENGELRELTAEDIRRTLPPVTEVFDYQANPYSFKESVPEKIELDTADLLAA